MAHVKIKPKCCTHTHTHLYIWVYGKAHIYIFWNNSKVSHYDKSKYVSIYEYTRILVWCCIQYTRADCEITTKTTIETKNEKHVG